MYAAMLDEKPASRAGLSSPISDYLHELRERLLSIKDGRVADYIPELFKAPADGFGIAVATIDGTVYTAGDADFPFTIQSMSKPFTYGYALQSLGREAVLKKVGVEPTGEAFNSIVLDDQHNRPFNPMVNAGAISVASLLIGSQDKSLVSPEALFSRFAGRTLDVDKDVMRSEQDTGHRNRAIAYMMLNTGMIDHAPEIVLDFYFRQCSVTVTCQDMAIMAATLANLGKNPKTEEQVLAPVHVQDVLTLMSTCGMYDYAGQWSYDVGIPAKSGVSGGVIAVIPGQAGIAIWSPPLDEVGNSVRGVEVCKAISRDFGLHAFAEKASAGMVVRRHYKASEIGSKRIRSISEREWLSNIAGQVQVMELQGTLYFGPAETIIRQLSDSLDDASEIIVDFTRVSYTDAAAARLLVEAFRAFCDLGLTVVLTGIQSKGPLALLRDMVVQQDLPVAIESDADTALEAAEERLLEEHYERADTSKYAFSKINIFAGLGRADCKVLEGIVRTYRYAPGEQIIREGDKATNVFVVASGSVNVSLELPNGRRKRLAAVGPGFAFGEMALVEGGARTADVFADNGAVCYVFEVAHINALQETNPKIPMTILGNLVKSLSKRLQTANQEIRLLE
ncbi:MAG: glutaminase A [Pseudomonadota bacterium]